MSLATLLVLAILAADPKDGVLPIGADGKPLNLDFETGTLKDWTATGEAFAGQPIKGDTVAPRRGDMKSQHQGQFWIGTYERKGDKPEGTLTSVAFKVTHPWASFLVAGGPHTTTSVELVRKETGDVFMRSSGLEEENLRRVAVDLRPHQGKEIFVRLVDRHTGHWGHVNFDDFRFHGEKPEVAARPTVEAPPPADVYRHAGLPPSEAAKAMTVPPGFSVLLSAGEPDVQQPIAFCLDDRGRVWVAEAYAYPVRVSAKEARDRILIFEDTNGDGVFDKRTVFMEGLNLISGLEVGFGGVWIGAAPYLMFVPINPGEDRPAGNPEILLDGWGWQDTHETLNTFTWGPDGYLYGCHGVFTHSRVGKPGTPDAERTPINAGIWRYHPTKKIFEVFAYGTSNPWGLDFNDWGQLFIEACVIPHNWHMIQGGRYQRQAGNHFQPHTYDDIKTIAEHRHYVGANPHGGNNRSDTAGGGHAHCGTMIYLGDAWPEAYRNQMFMANVHGHRINVDTLTPKGSGYVAGRATDFLMANDAWSRLINFQLAPDGNAYAIDWYDKQACHHTDTKIWDRGNGRVFKIVHKDAKPVTVDLGKKSDLELVALMLHKNDWYVRHARRLLQERSARQPLAAEVHDALAKIAFENADETRRLRGLWALHATGGLTPERIEKGLADKGAHVRGWTIQLGMESGTPTAALLAAMPRLAKDDPSPIVRLYLASALQRVAPAQRWATLENLVAHAEDAADHNLPLMYWYAADPLAVEDTARALDLARHAKTPNLLSFMTRRVVAGAAPDAVSALVKTVDRAPTPAEQRTMLRGLQEGLKGRRQVPMPAEWPAVFGKLLKSSDDEVRAVAMQVAVTFGDSRALDEMRRTVLDDGLATARRLEAMATLLEARDPQLAPALRTVLSDPALRGPAIRGLASYADALTPEVLVKLYPSLSTAEKRDALNTLASRPAYGQAMMDAVASKKVPSTDVPAEIVRQLRNLNDKALDRRIAEVWGVVRTATPADRLRSIAEYRKKVAVTAPAPELAHGRAVFQKVCAQCHTLYGVGGKVGPDITGSNRSDLAYLLENILDSSAVIPNEYKATLIELKNGRVVTGLVRGETPAALTVVTANETITIPKNEIESKAPSDTSMMPDDLLKPLTDLEVRALVAYLRNPSQVPMLATADNLKDFFNGKDLTGWDGDAKLWSVENGEIVGKSPGLQKNEFLKSHLLASDFRLTLKVKLTPNKENSGIQFRSEPLPGGEMKGPQADVGAGWWGKLYEESGRGLLWPKSGEEYVRTDQWNDYEIVAQGSKVKTFINGKPCVDLDDPMLSRRGIIGLQIHSGGPLEVRFKDLKLELLTK